MEEELISEGRCLFCNDMVSRDHMSRHLDQHLLELQKESLKAPQSYHHIQVEAGPYFLNLLVKGKARLEMIDYYLRAIWLECCGHASGFFMNNDELDLDNEVGEVFNTNAKVRYDYDFGTTTSVELIGGQQFMLSRTEPVVLMSRNEPLKMLCAICKVVPASYICSVCCYNEYAFFCKKCSKIHAKACEDFDDYAKMPVVNSPRAGDCGYEGGTIDKKRDGIWKGVK